MHSACWFAFVSYLVPLINTRTNAKSAKFKRSFTNKITVGNIFIEYFQMHVIADVFYINSASFVFPNRFLTGVLHSSCSDSLLTGIYYDIGVHFAKSFSVASKLRLQNV